VGVGTLTSQSFIKYVHENSISFIFSSVTDPVRAGLVTPGEGGQLMVGGVSNFVPLEPQITLFKELQPSLAKLGILYNPAELNSVAIVTQLEEVCTAHSIVLKKQTINKTSDVPQAATMLAQEVDAILISNDNTALAAFQSIAMAAQRAHIPVYVSDTDAVALGALAALGASQYEVGLQTAQMIANKLEGKHNALTVEFPSKTDLYLNQAVAYELGIAIPANRKKQAAQIIKRGNA
jgi:putative tryptophan/tyrosine transport system substrate-binding protein